MVIVAILIGCNRSVPEGTALTQVEHVEAKGQLLPLEIAQIFPPRAGVVKEIRAKPGDKISPKSEVVTLFDPELAAAYSGARDKFNVAVRSLGLFKLQLDDPNLSAQDRVPYLKELAQAENARDSAMAVMDSLDRQFNGGQPARTLGYFRAFAPDFDPKISRRVGTAYWTVLSQDRGESLLGKRVKPEQELLRVANLQGAWLIELKIPQPSIGKILQAFSDEKLRKEPVTGKKYLDVDVLLPSQPDMCYLGRLYRNDVSAEAAPKKTVHDEVEPVVTVYVRLNLDQADFPESRRIAPDQFVAGMEVCTRILLR